VCSPHPTGTAAAISEERRAMRARSGIRTFQMACVFCLGCTSVGALAGFLDMLSSMVSFNDDISEQIE
jgi:hypothetical protein